MARPTKLTQKWLDAAKDVIDEDINAIILTDEELVYMINDQVSESEQIDVRTYQRWKEKNKEEKEGELDELAEEFCRLVKKALIKQKKHLFYKFREEPNQWQRWAWIIERKFNDWNIKKELDVTSDGEKLSVAVVNYDQTNDSS